MVRRRIRRPDERRAGSEEGRRRSSQNDRQKRSSLKYAYSDDYTFELPEGHRFPIEKYRQCRRRLLEEGTIRPEQLFVPDPCERSRLELVHDTHYVDRVFSGQLSREEVRAIGFPWSPVLVERSRRSVAGTIAAARHAIYDGAGGNFAGGTHHAFSDHGEGFCVFNDIAVATRVLQSEGAVERVAVVDCDVHQGNGTASIFEGDASVFTLSIHGRNNWPFEKARSDLDIALDDDTGDAAYLAELTRALDQVFRFQPALVFFQAGVDVLASDRLGKLALSYEGLRDRDTMVLGECRKRDIPVAISFGGGYSERLEDVVEAHANTYRIAEGLFPT